MKSFKTQSKRVLDLMINSIYTNKEIFLRELVSNCSDAIDKLYFKGLKEGLSGLTRNDFAITVIADKDKRTLTISDNGIGMNKEDLENNLGTIARSGSLAFKTENADGLKADDLSVIGQFGVGFYSAFMVAEKVEVYSKAYGEDCAYLWVSKGTEGYDVLPTQKESHGTDIVLYIKPDTDDDNFSRYLEEYEIRSLIKKYSDYIRYPVFGVDATAAAVELIKKGKMSGTIKQDAAGMAKAVTKMAENGISEDKKLTDGLDGYTVDKDVLKIRIPYSKYLG